VVVGGGDAACEDTLALTKYAKQVYLVVRKDALRASKIMAERVMNHPQVKILWKTELKKVIGSVKVEAVELNNGKKLATDGVFLAIGHKPATEVFRDKIELDEKGFIKTNLLYPQTPGWLNTYPTMTKTPGVFAAGDVVDHRYKQAITAAGMGCMAALDAEKWLESKKQ
jgi:thioredoxin reductase (NADPH)